MDKCTICSETWSPTYYIKRVGTTFAICIFCALAIARAQREADRKELRDIHGP